MNIWQLDDIVSKEFYDKRGIVLGTDVYKVYIVGRLPYERDYEKHRQNEADRN